MTYKCFNCEKEIDPSLVVKRIICPYCGYRIITKARYEKIKKVKAR